MCQAGDGTWGADSSYICPCTWQAPACVARTAHLTLLLSRLAVCARAVHRCEMRRLRGSSPCGQTEPNGLRARLLSHSDKVSCRLAPSLMTGANCCSAALCFRNRCARKTPRPGIEPGSSAWQAEKLTTRLSWIEHCALRGINLFKNPLVLKAALAREVT